MGYRIKTVKPGDPIPDGRTEVPSRMFRLQAFLKEHCLEPGGDYYKRPDVYVDNHLRSYGLNEFGEDTREIAQEELLVLVWEKEDEVNEFGRVCP